MNDGDSYFMGYYEDGYKNGEGMLTKSDGSFQKGNWQHDQLKGIVKGRLRHKNTVTRDGDQINLNLNSSIDQTNNGLSDCSIYLNEKRPKIRVPRQRNRQKNLSVN